MTDPAEQSQIVMWAVNVTMALTVLGLVSSFVRLVRDRASRIASSRSTSSPCWQSPSQASWQSRTPSPTFSTSPVALALVAFLATVAFAWYAERKTALLNRDRGVTERMEETDGG